MINLRDSSILKVLPYAINRAPEVQALAYAINKQINKIEDYADATRTWSALNTIPEKMIDIMALELRTMYYDESLPLDSKRLLVLNTINIYKKLGTPSAVKDMVTYVCGETEVKEWHEYGGDPYLFRVYVTCNREKITYIHKNIVRLIDLVKNTRSWLEYVHYTEKLETITLRISSIIQTYQEQILNESIERQVAKKVLTKSLLELYSEQILNSNIEREVKAHVKIATNDNFGMYEEVVLNIGVSEKVFANINMFSAVVEKEKEVIY